METTELKDGLHESAKALAHCLTTLLGRDCKGFGSFEVRAIREARDRVRLHIDGGIYSSISRIVGEGVRVEVVKKTGEDCVWLRLRPDPRRKV